jgi:hypothetical protein
MRKLASAVVALQRGRPQFHGGHVNFQGLLPECGEHPFRSGSVARCIRAAMWWSGLPEVRDWSGWGQNVPGLTSGTVPQADRLVAAGGG